MQCSVLLYSLLYKYCCTAVWRLPPAQCSYCSRHRLSGRRSYLHPQFTAQLVGACSYWHLGTEHVFLWPCAYYYYFLRLKFLTTKFLTGDAVCTALSYPGSTFLFFYLPIRLFCAVFAALFAEGLLSSTSDSIVNLAIGGFACDIRHHIIGVCSSPFACRPATASVAAIL